MLLPQVIGRPLRALERSLDARVSDGSWLRALHMRKRPASSSWQARAESAYMRRLALEDAPSVGGLSADHFGWFACV